ncbi:MAG: hypothetical protein ACAH89_10290, partial [Rariglobus sp.]
MNRLAALLALAFAFVATAHAADLAPGLAYVRSADATVIAKALESGSVVLDLRTVTDPVKPLRVPRTRVLLVLVSPATPAASLPGAITFGRTAPDFKPDITVTTTVEADNKAVAALAAGTAPEKLIVENADKPRFDESLLVREHHTGAEPSAPADPAAKPADPAAQAPAVVDAVLQRSVQVYRGLVALKKIP